MYVLTQILLLGIVRLISLQYQNANSPTFPHASCWPYGHTGFQTFFQIMADDEKGQIQNIAGKVLNATYSQTVLRSTGKWKYSLLGEEAYTSLQTDSYFEQHVAVKDPTATLTFNFTDIVDEFALFADQDGIISTFKTAYLR
jgi:VCBS repeat-containing protein